MPTVDEIKQRIESGIPGSSAEVEDWTGTGDHFRAVVRSPAFSGKSRVQQHQIVYAALQGDMGGALHALALQTSAPE